jgi:Pentapeptide repeats (8 copies)
MAYIRNRASPTGADLSRADLSKAILIGAAMVGTNLLDATLTGCLIHGVTAWNVRLNEGTKQQGLIITPLGEPAVAVDRLEVAQFLYLLLHNEKIRHAIDTITSKVVLILGRFSPERKAVLDALRDDLHKRGYVPVVFDFEKPSTRTTGETVTLLAQVARFVIADVSDARSVLQELRGIVPDNPTLPVRPIIVADQEEPGMFDFFMRYPWFLGVHRYVNLAQLLAELNDRVIGPVEAEVAKLRS